MKRYIWLETICLVTVIAGSSLEAAIRVEAPMIEGIAIVRPADDAGFQLTVTNDGAGPAKGGLHAELWTPAGKMVGKIDSPLSLDVGASVRLPGSLLKDRELGVWRVTYVFAPAGGNKERGELRFAHMEPAGPNDHTPEFKFGVVAHHEKAADSAERRREIAAEALAGAKIVRSNPSWARIQPGPDQWEWAVMDEMMDAYESFGMHPEVLLAYTPRWAAPADVRDDRSDGGRNATRAAPDRAAWRRFVATFAARYRGRVPLWEPWNEPDLGFWRGTVEEYIDIAKIAIEEIRRIDPDAKMMSAGFATLKPHAGRARNPDMQRRVMEAIGPIVDYHAVHEHGTFSDFARLVDGGYVPMRAALPVPVPPLFFNETAISAVGGPNAERDQAWTLVKKTIFARARGAAGYLWYDLRNDGTDPANGEHNFGLITHDFQPKQAYVAFNTLARLVVPRPVVGQLSAGSDRWLVLFGADPAEKTASSLLCYWNEDVSSQGEQLMVQAPGVGRAWRIDVNGNASELPVSDGSILITLDAEPHYLLAQGAGTIEVSGRLIGPARAHFGGPGEEIVVAAEFINPTNHPQRVNTRWTTALSMATVVPGKPFLTLPPHGKVTASITVRLPNGDGYRFGQAANLRLDYDYAGLPYAGRLLIPVRYGSIVATAGEINAMRRPDIVLDRQDQLHSFVEADPQLQSEVWRGASDLSARVWLGSDADSLLIRIEVTDDKHHQTQPATAMWREDSVQCMLVVPGRRGIWEFGFADPETEGPMSMVWSRPVDAAEGTPTIQLSVDKTTSSGGGRVYTARISRKDLGLTDQVLAEGFRFNLAVNDHDGVVRSGALEVVPGLVAGKSVEKLPYVRFQNSRPPVGH